MKLTTLNRSAYLDAMLWAGDAYDDGPALGLILDRADSFELGGMVAITEGGCGLYFGATLGRLHVGLELRNIFPAVLHRASRRWAERRAEVLSQRYSEGLPTWETSVMKPGATEMTIETRYARQVYAHELDPMDGRTLVSIHLVPVEPHTPDLRSWLHADLWSSVAHDSSHNRRAPWNGTGWSTAWSCTWRTAPRHAQG